METKKHVSETVPAGEVAGESTHLLNNSNSIVMKTTRKVAGKLLVFGAAFFMVVSMGKAQEQVVKAADGTEAVSAVKEVKPAIVMGKELNAAIKKTTTLAPGYAKKKLAIGKATQMVWFTATVGDEEVPSTWEIGEITGTPASGTGTGCRLGNTGAYCAVRLQFDDTEVTAEELENKTLAEIQNDYNVTVIGSAHETP